MSQHIEMDHGSEKEESKDPFFPSDDSGDDEVSGKGRKQRRPAGEKVAPKDRNGLVKAKLPTVMRKVADSVCFIPSRVHP